MVEVNMTGIGDRVAESLVQNMFGNEIILGFVALVFVVIICLRFNMNYSAIFFISSGFAYLFVEELNILEGSVLVFIIVAVFIGVAVVLYELFARD